MLSWEELERQRQLGALGGPMSQQMMDPQTAAQVGLPQFGLEAGAAALNKGGPPVMRGDPSLMQKPAPEQSRGYGHQMTFRDMGEMMRRKKERGSMGIAQPHQAEAVTGDMPVGRRNNMVGMIKSLFA
jgi:hypothetical protein